MHLGVDINNIDLESILGPLAPGHLHVHRGTPAPLLADAVAAQRKALDAAPPVQESKRPKAQLSLVHGPALAGGYCGEHLQFTVALIAEDGQACRSGGVCVTALVTGVSLLSKTLPEPRPWVEDRQDGTYIVHFVCASPGRYDVTTCVDGIPLPMCPVQISITPGPASAACSELYGQGTQFCKVGGQAEFWIRGRDEFGNACDRGGSRFGVRAVGHARLHELVDNEDGTYAVLYSVPEWASGLVWLEVLLDGVSLKGSPLALCLVPPERGTSGGVLPSTDVAGQVGLVDQLEALHWLRENPPAPVPTLTSLGDPGTSGATAASSVAGVANHLLEGLPGDAVAARFAWRAVDEWRRLAEARNEMAKCRQALAEHQEVLLSVGDAVHQEFVQIEDQARSLSARKGQLGEVEARLDSLRVEMGWQYMQQQRWIAAGLHSSLGCRPMGEISTGCLEGGQAAGGLSAASPGGQAAFSGRAAWSALDTVRAQAPHRWPLEQAQHELAQLRALQEGIEEKRRYLDRLEEDDMLEGLLAKAPPLPPEAPPLDAAPPPEHVAGWPARSRSRGQRIAQPLPPPAPPPVLADSALSTEPACELSPGLVPSHTAQAASPSLALRDAAGWGLLQNAPRPPPSPPPAIICRETGGPLEATGSSAGFNDTCDGNVPLSGGEKAVGRGATRKELGQAMQHVFHAFASRTVGVVALPRGAKSGRMAMGLQDFLRLAHAAQLRLPNSGLEGVFCDTVRRCGGGVRAVEEDQSLAFEFFIELLVETARMHYKELDDGESFAVLCEEHVLPLARRLRELEKVAYCSPAPSMADIKAM